MQIKVYQDPKLQNLKFMRKSKSCKCCNLQQVGTELVIANLYIFTIIFLQVSIISRNSFQINIDNDNITEGNKSMIVSRQFQIKNIIMTQFQQKTSWDFDKKIQDVFRNLISLYWIIQYTKKIEQSINLSVSENNLTVFQILA